MESVLVVAPHAMDEVLGCGGTMALHGAGGCRVVTLVLFGDGTGMDAGRRVAAPAAAAALGTAPPVFIGFPENRGDTVPLIDVIGALERAVAEYQPGIVYVPHGGNLNIDHRIAFQAALTAVRPLPGHTVREIHAYEVVSSTEWSSPILAPSFVPARFVDIGAVLEQKFEALECYRSEIRDAPHPRSREGVRAQVRSRGFSVGFEAAEAFMTVRQLVASVGSGSGPGKP